MNDHDARHDQEDGFDPGRGFGGFLRSLLSGIPWSDRAERDEAFDLASPASGKVKVFNSNGRTRIIGEERTDIAVRARKIARAESDAAAHKLLDQIRINTTESGDALEIDVEIPRRWNRHGNVHLEVRLPRDHRLSVRSSNGKVCVEGMRCAVRAKSSNGPIKLTDVVGDIEVHTSNAKVACDCTRGRLLARSSNGKIELTDHCGSVDASTSNGIIHARLDEVGEPGVSLATSNGRIVLELPEKVDADLDMRVDNGIIRNDRELGSQTGTNGRIRGMLGRGGSVIKLRTSNGSISVR